MGDKHLLIDEELHKRLKNKAFNEQTDMKALASSILKKALKLEE